MKNVARLLTTLLLTGAALSASTPSAAFEAKAAGEETVTPVYEDFPTDDGSTVWGYTQYNDEVWTGAQVAIVRESDGAIVGETVSDDTGSFSVDVADTDSYHVVIASDAGQVLIDGALVNTATDSLDSPTAKTAPIGGGDTCTEESSTGCMRQGSFTAFGYTFVRFWCWDTCGKIPHYWSYWTYY